MGQGAAVAAQGGSALQPLHVVHGLGACPVSYTHLDVYKRQLKEFPDICFEGHSTDYQTATDLYNMVTDGSAILKVGPALTYGLREALFSLLSLIHI